MYLEDAEKAFDKIKRRRIWPSINKQLSGINPIARRLRERHRRTIYATKMKHKYVKVRMTEGIAQGDPNAQSLFVMTYEEFGHEIDEQREHLLAMSFDVPKYLLPELSKYPKETISLHKHMYVDDHAEIHTITKIPQIQALIQPILDVQQDWGIYY